MKRETWLPAAPASVRAARSLVRQAATEAGLDDACTWDLMLATSEAVANAIEHGTAWPNQCILLTTTPSSRGLRIEVCDRGTFAEAPKPGALEATCGRGIRIIRAVVDHLEVENGSDRTVVRFEKHTPLSSSIRPLPAPPPAGRRAATGSASGGSRV